jgi:hypothetical protein
MTTSAWLARNLETQGYCLSDGELCLQSETFALMERVHRVT